MLKLPPENFQYLHVGKAGGGTFVHRAQTIWQLEFDLCHPVPCRHLDDNIQHIGQNPHGRVYVMNVRDPIDRFVSAFYFATQMMCHPDGDRRQGWGGYPWEDPERYCIGTNHSEWKLYTEHMAGQTHVLFEKYQQNISTLAEALCEDDNHNHHREAEKDMTYIDHSNFLTSWLPEDPTFWNKNRLRRNIFPLVLESGFDFVRQVDDSLEWVFSKQIEYKNNINNNDIKKEFIRRYKMVRCHDCQESQKDAPVGADVRHPSNRKQRAKLSPRGHVCLAQYFTQDYALLEEMHRYM